MILAEQVARLGGGGVELPIGRIVVAFLVCIVIAVLAILLIRQRMGKYDLPEMFARMTPRGQAVEVVEVRRLSIHAEIGLVRHGGREYLLLLQAGSNTVLSDEPVAPTSGADAP